MTHTRTRLTAFEALFGIAVLAWTLRPIWDIDIFIHVAIGRELLANGLPSTDVLSSATPDAPWTPFQIGYELLVAELHRFVGLYGLNVLHSAVIAIAFVCMRRRFRQITGSDAATVLLLALTFITFEARVRPRPHVINLFLEALVLLPAAAGTLKLGDRKTWLALFATAAVWSAFHSMGSLWLVAVVGTWWVAGEDAGEGVITRRNALFATLATLVGVLIVPGSAPGIVHVLRVQDQWKEFVPELAPSWALIQLGYSGMLAFGCSLIALAAVLLAWLSSPTRARYPVLLSALGLAFGAVWLARLVYYAPFALALVWPELSRRLPMHWLTLRNASLASGVLALVLLGEVVPRYVSPFINPWTTTLHPRAFPVAELAALARAGIHGRAFNQTIWGGYTLYALHPAVTVMSDSRVTFGPEVREILRREKNTRAEVVADVAHARFGIDLLIWHRGRMRPNDHWQLIVQGEVADVFSRTGPVLEARKLALARAAMRTPRAP